MPSSDTHDIGPPEDNLLNLGPPAWVLGRAALPPFDVSPNSYPNTFRPMVLKWHTYLHKQSSKDRVAPATYHRRRSASRPNRWRVVNAFADVVTSLRRYLKLMGQDSSAFSGNTN